jgi:hypothetical protein
MTDQELSSLGERLYGAIIAAQLSEPALEDLANAISTRRPWTNLGERTKIAVFVVATQLADMDGDSSEAVIEEVVVGPPPPVDVADEEANSAGHTASELSADAAVGNPLGGHDAFDDAEAAPAEDAGRSIHQEALEADTTTAPAARAGENLKPKASEEAVDEEDNDSGDDDLEGERSEVVTKSRGDSSS